MASVVAGSSQFTTDSCSLYYSWVSVVHAYLASNCHASSSGTRVAVDSVMYKPPVVLSSLLDNARVERTTVPEPSAVGTIIGGGSLVFQRLHLLASRLAALLCVLCVLVVPNPSVNPSARSESFVLASARQDRMMKTLAPAVLPVLVLVFPPCHSKEVLALSLTH